MEPIQITKGAIEGKSKKDFGTPEEPKIVYSFNLGGKWYTTFNGEYYENFDKGDEVAVQYIMKGKYANIKEMTIIVKDFHPNVAKEEVLNESTQKESMVSFIQDENWNRWMEEINKFNQGHKVFATQTHVTPIVTGTSYKLIYTAILFFR